LQKGLKSHSDGVCLSLHIEKRIIIPAYHEKEEEALRKNWSAFSCWTTHLYSAIRLFWLEADYKIFAAGGTFQPKLVDTMY
jgi:hypothetical protein